MVLFDGEGVPSPAPPRVIPPRSGVWDDAGEGRNLGQGISRLLPPPGAGEERRRRGRGGGERGGQYPGSPSRACAPPGISPRYLPLLRGALGKGQYGFCRRGGGSLPGPSPGDIPPVRYME